EVHRDYDFLFYSAGSAASPVSLGTAPYNTASGLRDMVASGSDSFYKISVSTSTSYTIDLGTLTDNADLYVYDDLAMTNLLCSSVNTGTTAESCIANSGGAAILYIKVVYSGTGEGAAFDMGVN
ncbi:MAG: hypothetical protein OEX00_09630, partial [Gammaproteobacteria bacterium]|nr:hypothetical protein [Gammaproteobacteria bacterium]